MENLDKLVNELRKYKDETSWLEFKHNNFNPEMIGSHARLQRERSPISLPR